MFFRFRKAVRILYHLNNKLHDWQIGVETLNFTFDLFFLVLKPHTTQIHI